MARTTDAQKDSTRSTAFKDHHQGNGKPNTNTAEDTRTCRHRHHIVRQQGWRCDVDERIVQKTAEHTLPENHSLAPKKKRPGPLRRDQHGETRRNEGIFFTTDKNTFKVVCFPPPLQTEGKIYKAGGFPEHQRSPGRNGIESLAKLLSVMTHEIMNSIAPIIAGRNTEKQVAGLDQGPEQ